MPIRAAVLVALDEDPVAARDEKARRRVTHEVVIHRQVGALERPGDARFGDPHQTRGRRRLVNEPAGKISSRWLWEPTTDPNVQNVARSPFG